MSDSSPSFSPIRNFPVLPRDWDVVEAVPALWTMWVEAALLFAPDMKERDPDHFVAARVAEADFSEALDLLNALSRETEPDDVVHNGVNLIDRLDRKYDSEPDDVLTLSTKSGRKLGMVELYSVMAMTTVDSAADCYLQSDMDGIVRHLTDASKIMTLREVELSLEMGNDEMKKLARLRHSKDPKQVDKKKVRECWELWKADSSRYKGKAEFARDMLQKFDSLKSARVIEDWCREWESSAK